MKVNFKKPIIKFPAFSAIRYKILSAVIVFTVILGIAFMIVMSDTYKHYHKLQLTECFSIVKEEINKIENAILTLDTNVQALALSGRIVAKLDSHTQKAIAEKTIFDTVQNNEITAGAGLWFNDSGNNYYAHRYVYDILIDDSKYNFRNQSWYKELSQELSASQNHPNDVAWSAPYYDEHANRALMVTIGATIFDNNNSHPVGLATIDWKLDDIAKQISNIKIVKGSFSILIDLKHDILLASTAPNDADIGLSIKETLNSSSLELISSTQAIIETQINNKKFFSFTTRFANDLALFVFVPERILLKEIRRVTMISVLVLLIAALIAAIGIWKLLDKVINTPIEILSKAANELKKGNLNVNLNYQFNDEFQQLSDSFSSMVKNIKEHISKLNDINAERHRMETELNIAYKIQKSMLPSVFPPFPHRSDINIRGIMKPAKNVSGDFYDFFFCDQTHLAFVIADVSDKGVPAALFMVKAKTIIHTTALANKEPGTIFTIVNNLLCEQNDNCMFVTAVFGILNTKTGELLCSNAGHDPFYILTSNSNIRKITMPPGLPLGVKQDITYETSKFTLIKNSTLFLFTDGVTDAVNVDNELFGIKRLEQILKKNQEHLPNSLKKFLSNMTLELKDYTKKTTQADDITMLLLSYFGAPAPIIYTHTYMAELENLEPFMKKLKELLDEGQFSTKQKNLFCVGAEELFVNIINYSYPQKDEKSTIFVNITLLQNPNNLKLQIKDNGLPFNIIEHADPDITQEAKDRPIGGLGIFISKRSCNNIKYQRKDNENIVTMSLEDDFDSD